MSAHTLQGLKRTMVPILVIAAVYSLWHYSFDHVDPMALCSIDIREDTLGNTPATIRRALRHMKEVDPDGYRTVCDHVDIIEERRCVAGDLRVDTTVPTDLLGCYVRGTHHIYLGHTDDGTHDTVRERARLIAELASSSMRFWGSRE